MDADLDDDSSSGELYMILDASVSETTKKEVAPDLKNRMGELKDDDPVWKVYLYGSLSLTMVTTKFSWQLVELSAKEYEAAYA